MYYIYNIRIKKRYRLRGLEIYIASKIDNMDTSWVPLGRAKAINEYDQLDFGNKFESVLQELEKFGKKLEVKEKLDLMKERFVEF